MTDLENLTGADRQLVIVALQALHRERVTAYSSACTAAALAGLPTPEQRLFGLDEASEALRRMGAGPGVY